MSVFHLKMGFLVVGVATWFWGYRIENPGLRWIAIGFLVASFLLRFLERGRASPGRGGDGGQEGPPA